MKIADMPLPAGRSKQTPARIVVHAMAEYIDTDDRDYDARSWLDKLGLSVHALIAPSGVVIRCRSDYQGGYHARGYNTDSLGVEILVPGLHTYETFLDALQAPYYTTKQYSALVELVRGWRGRHGIENEDINRHSDLSPGRKVDPGAGFPWSQFCDGLGITGDE